MSKQGRSSDRPDPYAPFKRFYKDGGYVGSSDSKKNIEDDQTLYLSSQGFAGGGTVKFIKGLLGFAEPVVKESLDDLRYYSSRTGNEGFIFGRPSSGRRSELIEGLPSTVSPPARYSAFVNNRPDDPIFTAHTHPGSTAAPSYGDIHTWSNSNIGRWGGSPQFMWIESLLPSSSRGVALLEPYVDAEAARNTARNIEDLVDSRRNTLFRDRGAREEYRRHLHDWSRGVGFGENLDTSLMDILDAGWWSDRAAKLGVPLKMDPSTKIPGSDVTIGDAWPELINYYKKVGYEPYAEGGAVANDMLAYNSQYYADGGQVIPNDVNYLTPEVQQILDSYFADRILDEDLDAADESMAMQEIGRPPLDLASPNPFFPRGAPEVRFAEGGKVGIIKKLLEYTE